MNRQQLVAKIGEAAVAKIEALNVDVASANGIHQQTGTVALHADMWVEDIEGDRVCARVVYEFDADDFEECEDLSSLDWTPTSYDIVG